MMQSRNLFPIFLKTYHNKVHQYWSTIRQRRRICWFMPRGRPFSLVHHLLATCKSFLLLECGNGIDEFFPVWLRVRAFFTFHIHANRLFHTPTFLTSLDFHPTDPRFPHVGLLHALCAVGSLYTAEIDPPPVHTAPAFPCESFNILYISDHLAD